MASLPALDRGATLYTVIERLNLLIQEYNSRTPVPVANLPNAVLNEGARRIVTDATVTTFGSVVVGGGANIVPVYSNGTDWVIG